MCEDKMKAPMPELSIVVCTWNRLPSVKRMLGAFERVRTAHHWELIVVDDGSSDGTAEYLSQYAPALDNCTFKSTYIANSGVSVARNKGARLSRGSLIAFTDNDCYVAADFVTAIIAAFRARPKIGFLAGRVLLYDPDDIHFTIKESTCPVEYSPYSFLPIGSLHGANLTFRRQVFEHVGGFDPHFGLGTPFIAEDIVAAADALWLGYAGAYDPAPIVYHHHGRRTEEEFRAVSRGYDLGRGAYFARYIMRRESSLTYLRAYCRRFIEKKNNATPNKLQPWNENPTDHKRSKVRIVARELGAGLLYAISRSFKRPRAKSQSTM
jgi:glycosyltransferase involved in cell wall biosynthesis